MQLTYGFTPAIGSEGCIADSRLNADILSARTEGTVLPGRFVYVSENNGDRTPYVSHTAATGDVTGVNMLGIALCDSTMETVGGTDLQYPPLTVIPVARKARVWMKCETAVTTAPSQVFVRFTAGAGELTLGRVRNDVAGGQAVAIPGARFVTLCSAEGLVMVDFEAQN